MSQARIVIRSIASDRRMVIYGLLLLALHVIGILAVYSLIPEFDIINHLWFGYVLSEYSSRGASSLNLQMSLTKKLRRHGWLKADFRRVDLVVRLTGFLLIGGLLWETSELFLSPLVGITPDSFFAFPITLRNIDGTIDVTVGAIGASLAFLRSQK